MDGNEAQQLNGMAAAEQQPSAAVLYTQEPTPDEELSYLSVGGSDSGAEGAQSTPAADEVPEGEEGLDTACTTADVVVKAVAELHSAASGAAASSDADLSDALPLQVVDSALVAVVAGNAAAKADQPAAGNEEAAATVATGNPPTAAEQPQQAMEASAAVSPTSAVVAAKRVPARLLYGYKEGSAPTAAAEAKLPLPQPLQQQADRDKLEREKRRMYHPPADTPLTLPAYAVDDGGWETGVAARPPGYDPVDLFIGGLPPAADEAGVWSAVVPAGEVVSVKLIRRKRDRGECRGYGGRVEGHTTDPYPAAAAAASQPEILLGKRSEVSSTT